ncbi:MAG: recombinase family protein [Bacteroidota bacterium]
MKNLKVLKKFAKGKKVEVNSTGKYCVVYTRVSSKEQTENHSLEWQKKFCTEYAEKNGLSILGFFGGTYESAKNDERKEFNRMMRQLNQYKEKVSYILVYSLDRFSRSGENAIYISSELKKKGIHVMSVTQPIDVSTNAGTLHQNIQFIFSKFDNDQRRQKSVDGMREKLKRGEWLGQVPTGYMIDRTHGGREQIIIFNEKSKLIKKAFYWRLEGITLPEILKRLSAHGLKMPLQTLSDVLRNPFYCGFVSHSFLNGELVKGKHPALITEQTFLQVNNIPTHDGYQVSVDNINMPLKKFVRCAHCGTTMGGYLVHKKNLFYYKCNKRLCKNNRGAQQMHDKFMDLLTGLQIKPEYIEPAKRQLEYTYQNLTDNTASTIRILNNKRSEVSAKLDTVVERFATGEIDKNVYDKVAGKLEAEKAQIDEEMEKTQIRVSNPKKVIEYVTLLISKLASTWSSSNYHQKLTLQRIVFPDGLRYDRKNDMYLTPRVNRTFELISLLSGNYKNEKSRIDSFFDNQSGLVAGAGLEPTAFGL